MGEKNMGQWVEGKQLTVKEVEAMGNKIKGKIDGLVEGCEYKFRIRAVNKGGPSKPGPPSDSMIAKHRFIPPHLLGDGIYDITLKKGRPIRYDLWFGGEPAPSCEWLREGRTLTANEDMSIELYSKKNNILEPFATIFIFLSVGFSLLFYSTILPLPGRLVGRHCSAPFDSLLHSFFNSNFLSLFTKYLIPRLLCTH